MKKTLLFLGISLLVIVILLGSSQIILAQPEAKKICFYPKFKASSDVELSNLNPSEAKCYDDAETLSIFNSAQRSLLKFTISQGGGRIGTFTDSNNKVHLIRIISSDGIIRDDTENKTYTIKDPKAREKWYDLVRIAVRKN